MAATKMLRVSDRTHDGFRREAQRRGATIDEVAAAATRARRHKDMGDSVGRLAQPIGNVGPQVLNQMREILADLLDLGRTDPQQ